MDNKDFVSYDLAKRLKECGFDCLCHNSYCEGDIIKTRIYRVYSDCPQNWNNPLSIDDEEKRMRASKGCHCSAPTLWQAQKWLREKKNIEVVVIPLFSDWKRIGYDWNVHDDFSGDYSLRGTLPFAQTYEQALQEGIKAALELINHTYK